MLALTLTVNGREIGRVEMINRGRPIDFTHSLPDDARMYEVSFCLHSEDGARRSGEFMLLHNRNDGAAMLAKKALAKINSR